MGKKTNKGGGVFDVTSDSPSKRFNTRVAPVDTIIGIRQGVSKRVEDGRTPPILWVGHP
jgi:hypothetical protein